MREVHVGLYAISVGIPADVFATRKEKSKAFVTFEDMHFLLNYRRLCNIPDVTDTKTGSCHHKHCIA